MNPAAMNPMMPYYMTPPPQQQHLHPQQQQQQQQQHHLYPLQQQHLHPQQQQHLHPQQQQYQQPPPPLPPSQLQSSPSMSSNFQQNDYRMNNNWNTRPPEPSNWDRNGRYMWRAPKNWNYGRNAQLPYNMKKKPFSPNRFHPKRFENGSGGNYFENEHSPPNNHNHNNWQQQQPPLPQAYKNRPNRPNVERDETLQEKLIPGTVINKKKRKPMSKSYPTIKWNEEDAIKALEAEKDFNKNIKSQSLIIRFPDLELNKDVVKQFHPAIEKVHFPQASAARYCFIHLEETADIDKVIQTLEKTPFGQGFLGVDIKKAREEPADVSPKTIDPYTLYVGNLPMNVTKASIIPHFPGYFRVDIGHPLQMKNTRYAFVRFTNVEDAIKAYKNKRNAQFESRSLIVRFRRLNGSLDVRGEVRQVTPKTTNENITPTATATITTAASISTSENKIPVTSTTNSTYTSTPSPPDLILVKTEPINEEYESYVEYKPDITTLSSTTTVIKHEVKNECPDVQYDDYPLHSCNEDDVEQLEDDEFCQDNFHYADDYADYYSDDYEDEDNCEDDSGQKNEVYPNDTFLLADKDEDIYD